jgi:hypothetical protein
MTLWTASGRPSSGFNARMGTWAYENSEGTVRWGLTLCWAAVRTIPVTSEGQGEPGPSGKEDDRARGVSERVASERMERAGCLGLGGWPREVRSSHIRNVTAAKDVDVGVTQPFRQYICHKRPRP